MKMTTWESLHPHPRYSGSKIHLESQEHQFSIFIKSVVEDAVYRIEESLHAPKRAVEAGPRQHQMLSIEIEAY
jgi:hypothetical protein